MTSITEIAPDLYRISTRAPRIDLQYNEFLLKDDEPLLFHTGLRRMFSDVRDAVARVVDPARIRWICFSHFEADECGALNEWLDTAPQAEPLCSLVAALVSVDDFASRRARHLAHGEVLPTGKYRLRFLQTPHVPHCWEAGLLFEEVEVTLFCSDLFQHTGDVAPLTESVVLEPHRRMLLGMQAGPFANYLPYTADTDRILQELARLKPRRLATMHGSSFVGDGARALRDRARVLRETLGGPTSGS